MESLIHYVWKYRLYDVGNAVANNGSRFEVIDPGLQNSDAGPDFFNAKIKMGDAVWVGNVEIHSASSDWQKHHHEQDKAYNSVILHVTEKIDGDIYDESGRLIPQWEIKIPEKIVENYRFLLESDYPVPCAGHIREIPEIYLNDWKSALLTERLERKTNNLLQLLKDYKNDWNTVFYITLSRNFGFGINNDAFERLAKSLPLKCVLKHCDSALQTEALFLGQAGLLADGEQADEYYARLRQEYIFLAKKYKLNPLEAHIFKNLRIRPDNFPHIKIVQLASIIRNRENLFSHVLEIEDKSLFFDLFRSDPSEYWQTHFRFGKLTPKRVRLLGMSSMELLLINTVVPLLFAYGKKKNEEKFTARALNILDSLKPEKNAVITQFSRAGITFRNAGDSQAVIQLKREYCEKKKCIYCRIGHKLLSKK
ncbi:MAG: DUF2851 family protein [Dysgonamonadaceae bacterium]|jgi:hypothetical protein|nr:DUF2851 family protein [Dysgonamonadaceae bacterium]